MSFVPEDRLGMGLAASLDIADNMMLKAIAIPNLHSRRTQAVGGNGREVIEQLGVVTSGVKTSRFAC